MPKAKELLIIPEKKDLRKLSYPEKTNIRIGFYYSKFNTHQKARFNRIVNSLCNKYGLDQRSSPGELILIRNIAISVIRLDRAYSKIIQEEQEETTDYAAEREKWIINSRKALRDDLQTLSVITKVSKKKMGIGGFDDLRGDLREKEGLPPSKHKGVLLDGHGRRYHDDKVSRTEK